MSNMTLREQKVNEFLLTPSVTDQIVSLIGNDERKKQSFMTKMVKISTSFGLDKCSPDSIVNCGLQALTLNLSLEQGQGYVVNYGGQAQFDCGYKGWQILAKRAGYSVQADVVYSCDDFRQEGFGFDRKMIFNPDFSSRKGHDDEWAKQNLQGVIVSILEDETGNKYDTFVTGEMIKKITGVSPSAGKVSKKTGEKHSPHDKWAEQMFMAKAIKQVLSKFAIDISEASELHTAIEIVNQTESMAQEQAKAEFYPDEDFEKNFPKWAESVKSGQRSAMSIITFVTNKAMLKEHQMTKLMSLKTMEPIEGEVSNVE